ncbi:MAG: hypothetical protein ACXWYS_01355 [Gaiellaceae bacterium]
MSSRVGVAHEADAATTLTLRDADAARLVEFERRDSLVEELDDPDAAVRHEEAFETGPDEGIAALRVILDAVGA